MIYFVPPVCHIRILYYISFKIQKIYIVWNFDAEGVCGIERSKIKRKKEVYNDKVLG